MLNALEAIFPAKAGALVVDLEQGQTLSSGTIDVALVARFDSLVLLDGVLVPLLPSKETEPQRTESFLLAFGLCLERALVKVLAEAEEQLQNFGNTPASRRPEGYVPVVLETFLQDWIMVLQGNNHPLLLAKAQTVEDFVKALETKGRLGRWL